MRKTLLLVAILSILPLRAQGQPVVADRASQRDAASSSVSLAQVSEALAQLSNLDADLMKADAALRKVDADLLRPGVGVLGAPGKLAMETQGRMLEDAGLKVNASLMRLELMQPGLAFQRDRAVEIADRDYERGTKALDKRQWDEAMTYFNEVVGAGKTRVDGALYWKAYALGKLGRGKEAVATLEELAKSHPQSRWLNDAKAMRVEIAQAAGKPLAPEDATDDDIKLMAINSLMQSDPERSVPLLEKLLQTQSSPKLRERALFVLSQSDSPKAAEVVARVAKGGSNPDLQLKAIRSLGAYGGKKNRDLLADIYASSNDAGIKKQVLNSYMVSGERDKLLAIAKSDPNVEMRKDAIHYLGTMGANSQLSDLYSTESSTEVRARILQGLFVGGNTTKLIEVAKNEKDPELRNRAVQFLGNSPSGAASDALVAMYANSDNDTKKRVMQALFNQNSAKQLVEIARKETNPDLRRTAVQHLSHMKSKDASDFLMELLNK